MSVDDSLLSYLSSHLLVQRKPITYRLLSREKNLHVTDARGALESFHQGRNGKEVKATFVLQGRLEESGDEMILLVGEDRLEETKSTFQQTDLTVQMYSLTPSSPSSSKSLTHSDLAFFSTVPLTLSSDKTYTTAWEQADRGRDFGVIYNERTKKGDPRAAQAAQELQKANAAAAASVSVKQEKTSSTAKPPQQTSSTSKVPQQSTSSTKTATGNGLNWSKAKNKPAEKHTKAPPPKAASDDEGDSDVEMAQIGYGDSDEEADEKPVGSSRVKRADAVVPPPSGTTFSSRDGGRGKSDADREEQRRKLREMMEVEEDQDGPGEAVPDVASKDDLSTSTMKGTESNADSDVEMQAAPQRRKIRRRKRTVRKERTKDAKGYMVTKEVSDYESYSDWTESEEAAPTKGNKKKASGGKVAQASSSTTAKNKSEPVPAPELATEARKSPSPPKAGAAPAKPSGGAGGAKKGGGGGAGGSGQSKLSSFFKKG